MTNHAPFTLAILKWFDQYGRDLPWRGISDPYAIWLSEIILQQTRIVQGTGYWHRFMATFPTVEALAAASEDDVLKLWQGLGYYSRARNLHHAAKSIVELGHFPATYAEIRRLKGVGDYTAAAIASTAFGLPHAAVDGNVFRVLARHFGIATAIDTTTGKHEFQALANELCPRDKAGNWNQAMMDFGALVCTPQSPRCLSCPVAETCVALRTKAIDHLPVKGKQISRRERYFLYYYIRCNDKIAFHQRGKGDIWQGLWEPPMVEADSPFNDGDGKIIKHVLTHQTIYAQMQERQTLPQGLPYDCVWIAEEDIKDYAIPRLVEIMLSRKGLSLR